MPLFRSGFLFFRDALAYSCVPVFTLEYVRLFFASGRRRALAAFLFSEPSFTLFGKGKNQLKREFSGVFWSKTAFFGE